MSRVLGDKIKQCRDAKGWSTVKLCEVAHISRSYLFNLENDEIQNPNVEKMEQIAHALDVEIDVLYDTFGHDKSDRNLAYDEAFCNLLLRTSWEDIGNVLRDKITLH